MNHGYSVFTSQTLCAGKSNWLLNGGGGGSFSESRCLLSCYPSILEGEKTKA